MNSESQSAAAQPLATLRDGIPVILLTTLVVVAISLAVSLRQESLYRATAQVFVATNAINTPIGNLPLISTEPDRVLSTQAQVARVPKVAALAAKQSRTDVTPDELLADSEVTANADADILTFTVTDGDPDRAERLANAYANGYVQYRTQLDTTALARAQAELEKQISDLGNTDPGALADLLNQRQSLRTREILLQQNSTLGKPAESATKIQPKPVQAGLLGAVIGLILGITLVFIRDAVNTRVRNPREIESRLGMPLLGRIPPPNRRLDRYSLATLEDPESYQAEAYRMLATSIELVNMERGAKTIMITSALRGEGKSTSAANLGVTLARRGYKVAIMEADLRRPVLARMFDLEKGPGLTDVALGHAQLSEALRRIELPAEQGLSTNGAGGASGTLDVLTSGPTPPSPAEFLKLDAVNGVVKKLSLQANVVLIDTPPLLHLSDVTTMALSPDIDAVVAAAKLGLARRHSIDELKRVLDSAPVVKLGFFVTGSTPAEEYGYRYAPFGYGYSDAPAGGSRRPSLLRGRNG